MVALVFGPAIIAAGVGIVSALWTRWQIASVTEAIAGISITGGLLFSLLVFVFQLRLQVAHDPRTQQRVRVPLLIDQLFATIIVATATAGVLVSLLVAAGATIVDDPTTVGSEPLHWAWTPVLLPGSVFYFTLLIVLVIRTRSAYRVAISGNEIKANSD